MITKLSRDPGIPEQYSKWDPRRYTARFGAWLGDKYFKNTDPVVTKNELTYRIPDIHRQPVATLGNSKPLQPQQVTSAQSPRVVEYAMTPEQSYIYAFGDNVDLGRREYQKAMEARRRALLKRKNDYNYAYFEDETRRKMPGVLPSFAKFDTKNGLPQILNKSGDKNVQVIQITRPVTGRTVAAAGGQSMYAPTRASSAGGLVIGGDFRKSEIIPYWKRQLHGIGGIMRNLYHELSHAATRYLYNPADKLVPTEHQVRYTSSRKGYGNNIAEASGGMHQLKGWFARNYNFVPESWDSAVAFLAKHGYIDRAKNSRYNEYRFTDKFQDEYTNGINTTLDDVLTNQGWYEKQPSWHREYNYIPNVPKNNNELWDLSNNYRKTGDKYIG